jgi:hypothetical protein
VPANVAVEALPADVALVAVVALPLRLPEKVGAVTVLVKEPVDVDIPPANAKPPASVRVKITAL